MGPKEAEDICKLVPLFIAITENDLGEDEHDVKGQTLTYAQFEQIQALSNKLQNCINFVDMTLFE